MDITKATLSEFPEPRPYFQQLNEWRPRCEYCIRPGAILITRAQDTHRVLCPDCFNRFIKSSLASRSIQFAAVLPRTTIRNIEPEYHKQNAELWGKTIPPGVKEFFMSKSDIKDGNYNAR